MVISRKGLHLQCQRIIFIIQRSEHFLCLHVIYVSLDKILGCCYPTELLKRCFV